MTGMPRSTAACTVGWIAVPSWARMMMTFAPSVISCSTFVACFSADEPASLPTYVPPAPSTTCLDAGLVPLGPALFLEVVPRHADLAAGGGATRCGGARSRELRSCPSSTPRRERLRPRPGPPACEHACAISSSTVDLTGRRNPRGPARRLQRPGHPFHAGRRRAATSVRMMVAARPRHPGARQVNARRAPNQAAGSASSGSNASSAAPTSGASTPSVAGTTDTSVRGAGSARRASSASSTSRT